MKKLLITILAIGCIYLIYKQFNVQSLNKENSENMASKSPNEKIKNNTKMPTKEDFDKILEEKGLSACYSFDALEQENQSKIASKKDILSAFEEGVDALFIKNEQNKNADNLVSGILESPSDFGLPNNPSVEDIKKTIAKGLKEDKNLTITLLPEKTAENSGIFPPEEGESVNDFWIWYVKAPNYFPGPIWILVKRDGTMPAYHYGKM